MSDPLRTVPPHDERAEQAVIGSLMLAGGAGQPEVVSAVTAILGEGADLYSPRLQAIYRAIVELHADGEGIDVVTVGDALDRAGRLDQCGGHAYIMELLQSVPHAAHAVYYARIVASTARERSIADEAWRCSQTLRASDVDDAEKAAARARLRDCLEADGRALAHGPISLAAIWETIEPRKLESRRIFPIGAGFESVELYAGKIVTIAAQPSDGKTALALQWTVDALISDDSLTALVANVEMTRDVLMHRQLSRLGGVPFDSIMRRPPNLAMLYGDRLDFGLSRLADIKPRLYFARNEKSIESIVRDAAAIKPDIVLLDYTQRLQTATDPDNARERIGQVMGHARDMAKQGACVLAISSVSRRRDGSGSTYRGLSKSSMRDSGDMEFDADDCWILERDGEPDGGVQPMALWADKCRNGAKPRLQLDFHGRFQRFEAAAPVPAIQEPEGVLL